MSSIALARHSDEFSSAPQLAPEDLAAVAAAGFRSVINNRPDGEGGAAQPPSDALAAAAAAAGIEYVYLPVVPSEIDAAAVARFSEALAKLPRPILGFCYTGGRAAKLYKLATER